MTPLLYRILGCLLAALVTFSLPAQDPAHTATAPTKAQRSVNDTKISLEFPGGTLAAFLGAVRAKYPEINVIVNEQADIVKVPAVTVVDAGVEAVLQAVVGAGNERYRMNLSTQQTNGNPVYSIGIYQQNMTAGSVQPSNHSEVRVLSLRKLTEKNFMDPKDRPVALPPATILSAIEFGSKGMIEAPKMRYHEDSGLLFVQGTAEQQELVRQVLQNLEKDQDMLRLGNQQRIQAEANKEFEARQAEQRRKAEAAAEAPKDGKRADR